MSYEPLVHFQDPDEEWYAQPACGAHPHHTGPATADIGSVTCRVCLPIAHRGAPDDQGDQK